MPDKLTDLEIKKALECCSVVGHFVCNECPAWVNSHCTLKIEDIIDLLNRQEEKIKLLEKYQTEFLKERLKTEELEERLGEVKAENERLLQELQLMSEENIVHCKECKHLMFSDFEGECSKGYKGIVRPNDSCPFGVRERGESK